MTTNTISLDARSAFSAAGAFHPNDLSYVVYLEKYSRWNDDIGRRETWPETVQRGVDYLKELVRDFGRPLPEETWQLIHNYILNMKVLPSMRLLAMAGKAARRSHITLYNCAYSPVDALETFVEALIISMSGTGFGYSVENKYVQKLPTIIPQRGLNPVTFTVEDSAEGWADALRFGITSWYNGFDAIFNLSLLRPAGAVLHTKGGRSSGPEPLRNMLKFCRNTILSRQGSKLSSLDAHDIMGNIALGAVSGGHRRSAMISLYSWDDKEMRHCKDGEFWNTAPWRTTANNSAVIDGYDVADADLRDHFRAMVTGGNGEPGIFSRMAARGMRPYRRQDSDFGTNPCAEISLRPQEFCNLTEVILRPEDTRESIINKTYVATLIGTIQSLATNFPGLRKQWTENCQEERLLGVGYTGQMDCPTFQTPGVMRDCQEYARTINEAVAKHFGIPQSASITCVKPSGSTSVLVDSSSGLHTRWAPYYMKNVRLMATGPVARTLLMNNFPMDPENGQDWNNMDTVVAHFPIKSPDHSVYRNQKSALEQCEYWKMVKLNLTEHNPSVTITYKPEEAQVVEDWIVDNRKILGGMAFLPHFEEDVSLRQMPYVELTEEEYNKAAALVPAMDYSFIAQLEHEDQTTSAQEVSCSSGQCDV